MLTDWSNCARCNLGNKRTGNVKLASNNKGRVMLILSEILEKEDRRWNFLEKILDNASEGKLDSWDLSIVDVVGCVTPRKAGKFSHPFKDTTDLTTTQIGACKERIYHIIDTVDPNVIIISGPAAARSLGIISGLRKMFETEELREVDIKGHLVKVPRMVGAVPTFNWLVNNFSRDPDGSTANTVRLFRKAIQYSNLTEEKIGGQS